MSTWSNGESGMTLGSRGSRMERIVNGCTNRWTDPQYAGAAGGDDADLARLRAYARTEMPADDLTVPRAERRRAGVVRHNPLRL